MDEDKIYMRRAVRLAGRSRGLVSPGALVGAVIVHKGTIVGEAAYKSLGGPHAETEAIAAAGERCRGSTLYVSLEPCAHYGSTPPCADAIISAGIRRVVCALEDPDRRVCGKGFRRLRKAGVLVEVGLLADEAERGNAAFLTHRRTGKPLVILKLAQTLDGRIATKFKSSKWITGKKARQHAHLWRSWVDGVMVGAGTVLSDNPRLNVRHVRGPNPRPMVVDCKLRISPEAAIFESRTAILITSDAVSSHQLRKFETAGAEIWTFPTIEGHVDLQNLICFAGKSGMTSLVIEGGRGLATAALQEKIVNEILLYVSPRILGEGINGVGDLDSKEVADGITLEHMGVKRLGCDLLLSGKVVYPCSLD